MYLQRIYKTSFEMSHIIPNHPVCGVNHGHSYQLAIYLDGDSDTWLDFHDIKTIVEEEIKGKYDHKVNPETKEVYGLSAEELAMKIGQYLADKGYSGDLELYETSKYGVKFNFGKLVKVPKEIAVNVSNQ